MVTIPHAQGMAFRDWAPHADRVLVTRSFYNWDESTQLTKYENGIWYIDLPSAKIGDDYRYLIFNGEEELSRIDVAAAGTAK